MGNKSAGVGIAGSACLTMLAIIAAGVLISGWVFQFVWNAFVPAVFGGPTIDLPTAIAGTLLLSFIGSAFRSVSSK